MDRAAKLAALQRISWTEVEDWVGATIARRGRSYHNGGSVRDLAHTTDGALVAWVHGTQRYATLVDVAADGPVAACSCPYAGICKHAVAVLLAYQAAAGQRRELPTAADSDLRLRVLAAEDDVWDEEEAWDDEAAGDDGLDTAGGRANAPLRTFLEGLTREELVALLDELAGRLPEVRSALEARQLLAASGAGPLVREVRALIYSTSARPGWRDSWHGDGFIPDYTPVRDRLALLLRRGHADQVVELGEELLEAGNRQVEESQDEGETAAEIAACLTIVFEALAQSSLTPADRMLRAIEWELRDSYDLCAGAAAFWEQPLAAAEWSQVADALLARLEREPAAGDGDDVFGGYRRDRLADRAIQALERAGRDEEIIPLCEREAELNGSYVRLVQYLVAAGRTADAERWIGTGITALDATKPGLAAQLRDMQLKLWEQAEDWPRVAAFRAEAFFREPAMRTLLPLRAAAERAGVWPAVRAAVLHYLETGAPPAAAERRIGDVAIPPWPLPATGLPPSTKQWRPSFPMVSVLIELAADEGRPDEVLRWYDQRRAHAGAAYVQDSLVAEAVADAYPERAIAIWKALAEAQIARTEPRAYEVAAEYLRKMHRVLARQGKTDAWREYIAQLREANRRKRRLIEILDRLAASR